MEALLGQELSEGKLQGMGIALERQTLDQDHEMKWALLQLSLPLLLSKLLLQVLQGLAIERRGCWTSWL
jgi:hypothetical protein